MKDFISKIIFILFDILVIALSIYLAYIVRSNFEALKFNIIPLENYLFLYPLYIIPIVLFAYEGIYTYRYDFWHESRLVIKGLVFSTILIFAYLAMTQSVEDYSRLVIGFAFLFMTVLIPLSKNISKKVLHLMGIWHKSAIVYGDDPFLQDEIYGNPYLGYVKPKKGQEPSTVFINSKRSEVDVLRKIIASQIQQRHEVVFIPLIDDYDMTQSHIYELSNTRTNLIVFQNRLKSKYRLILKKVSDFTLSVFIFPFLIPIMIFIAFRIKKSNPEEPILFKQKRLGQDGKPFICYKFRTMHEESDEVLATYLSEHPEEIDYYAKYHKYKNDPRITQVGHFLRRTSLDELPQIFNVFKQEMSFIGPRPYMMNEKKKIGNESETILTVKPGITGLWQVSGRSDVDFEARIELDVWYIRNWNLWMDLVILIKTIKTVLLKDGAQ